MLSLNHACSGLLGLAYNQNHSASDYLLPQSGLLVPFFFSWEPSSPGILLLLGNLLLGDPLSLESFFEPNPLQSLLLRFDFKDFDACHGTSPENKIMSAPYILDYDESKMRVIPRGLPHLA
jgi:hypothetical protein